MQTLIITLIVIAIVSIVIINIKCKSVPEVLPKPKENANFWDEYERCRDYIREKLKEIYPYCENTRTIEASNKIFYRTLNDAKCKIYSTVKINEKDQVIEAVEKYYAF